MPLKQIKQVLPFGDGRARLLAPGFTLLELLVVIAIGAVLAGLLFPVFARAKAAAYEATALSDARQLGEANLLYDNDYDNVYCPYFSGYNPATGQYEGIQQYWPQLVSTYVAKLQGHGVLGQALADDLPKIFFDPIKPFRSQYTSWFRYGIISSWGVSDDIVNWYAPIGTTPAKMPIGEAQVAAPSLCAHLVETYDWLLNQGFPGDAIALSSFDDAGYGAKISIDAPYGATYQRSSVSQAADPKGHNVTLFCDGHVRAVTASVLQNSGLYWSVGGNSAWP